MSLRVLLVCDWFLKTAARHAVALRSTGANVGLLCRTHALEFGGSHEEREELIADVCEAGVDLFEVPGRFSSVRVLPTLGALARSIRSWKPMIVHAHDNYDPRLFLLTQGYPSLVTVHDPRPHLGARGIGTFRDVIRRAWRARAARLVVHGEEPRTTLAAVHRSAKIVVLPLGIDLEPEPVARPRRPCVLFFGRLEAYKGLRVLLDAMNIVWGSRPEVRLMVVGTGPEEALVPPDPRIDASFGYLPENQISNVFRRASLVVLPYLDGSQSAVGLLALARGIPVVVTEVGSLPELAFSSAFVVPPGDSGALAAGLLRFVDHDDDLRRQVFAHAEANFSWDAVAQKSLEIYDTVLHSRTAVGADEAAVHLP
jgi:alpha-maltose-1-phosphate synthase